ncbi:pseudouridine synthase [Ruminiclostridium cellulolyticum]|uniref:Pseudouridine synthase n=1 Tax=Ruminiclostridium cellulolyticum (strain ATCC 35319 / DSM 5812 / JCM 6584 / H10) TaxID=394503 RepID=B8I2V1_RUMCH|nr:pseudouridine synthase [Ruminiclostridium cellulolyticum]ACL76094.1 pseudouridine synthase [Ruminiclostridium cellulolyticum H10]
MLGIRLQKFIAHAGVASRRTAEEMIKQGRVAVNNTVVQDMGFTVSNDDFVTVDGKPVKIEEEKVYIMLHKPVGYVSTSQDQFGRPTVVDLVKDAGKRLYPVGRLDYDTSGLILLTNDGDFTYRLTHPKHEINKVYEAVISGFPEKNEIKSFESGLKIENYQTSPAEFVVLEKQGINTLVRITIHEGKNRQVRKMCEAIGHKVLTLKRIQIGPIALDNLPVGKWRHLSLRELKMLY